MRFPERKPIVGDLKGGPQRENSSLGSRNEDALRLAILDFRHIEEKPTAKHKSGSVLGGAFESPVQVL
jgi:hypothetical protein